MESYAGSGFEYWRGVPCWRTDFFARAEHFGINIYTCNIHIISISTKNSIEPLDPIITVLFNHCHYLYPFELKTYFSQLSAEI